MSGIRPLATFPIGHDLLELSVTPGDPSGVTSSPTGGTTGTTTWTAGSPAGTGYEVQIESPAGAGNWTAASGTRTGASFSHTGQTPYTSYRTRVRATDGGLFSGYATGGEWFTDNTGTGGGALPQLITLQVAQSTDAAVNLLLATALQVAQETSQAFNQLLVNVLQVAVESDESVPLNLVGELQAGQETDQAFNLPLVLQLQPAPEADEALPLILVDTNAITAAVETDQAIILVLISPLVLGVALEFDAAVSLDDVALEVNPTGFYRRTARNILAGRVNADGNDVMLRIGARRKRW